MRLGTLGGYPDELAQKFVDSRRAEARPLTLEYCKSVINQRLLKSEYLGTKRLSHTTRHDVELFRAAELAEPRKQQWRSVNKSLTLIREGTARVAHGDALQGARRPGVLQVHGRARELICRYHPGPAPSMMIRAGIDVLRVARPLGHKTPDITLRVYGHLIRQGKDDAAERLEEVMFGTIRNRSVTSAGVTVDVPNELARNVKVLVPEIGTELACLSVSSRSIFAQCIERSYPRLYPHLDRQRRSEGRIWRCTKRGLPPAPQLTSKFDAEPSRMAGIWKLSLQQTAPEPPVGALK